MMEAYKISSRVAHVGFDWPNIEGLFDKLKKRRTSCARTWKNIPRRGRNRSRQAGVAGARGVKSFPELRARLEDEVGDLLFVLVNIARYLSLDPESALRKTNRKFRRRFQYLEDRLREQGRKPDEASLGEMESLWQESKRQEKPERSIELRRPAATWRNFTPALRCRKKSGASPITNWSRCASFHLRPKSVDR